MESSTSTMYSSTQHQQYTSSLSPSHQGLQQPTVGHDDSQPYSDEDEDLLAGQVGFMGADDRSRRSAVTKDRSCVSKTVRHDIINEGEEIHVSYHQQQRHLDLGPGHPNGHAMIPAASSAANRGGASTATRELDDLMTSLNDNFHAKLAVEEEAAAVAAGGNLDEMLGNLKEDMDKQGVQVARKGVCHACGKAIVGHVFTALGRTFHPEHFLCAHCNQELGTGNFFERDGRPYCEADYHLLFSPRCAGCQGPILDKCLSALDRTWHPEHFVCSRCGAADLDGEDGFHEKDGAAFCRNCFLGAFAPKCGGCDHPIEENYISSLDRQWHPGCFVCVKCGEPFVDGNYFEHEGQPYCETHYHAMRGSLCAGCGKPISGRCITAMFRKFHPEHFACSFCLKQLNKGTFKEQGEKPYCHECYDRLFG